MTNPVCNHCFFYKSRFPGYYTRTSLSLPVRCSAERDYRGEPYGKCGKSGQFFRPKPQKAIGYYDPAEGLQR